MTDTLISIIIPVYQAENTIERCIKSIVSHKSRIEIICVDDGSTDNTSAILDLLAQQDYRLTIKHQDNQGAGFARNVGLSLAKGDYIMFCDSDDSYLPDTIDLIADDILKYNPDYLVFHRKTITLDGRVQFLGTDNEPYGFLTGDKYDYLNEYLFQNGHTTAMYNKVIRRKIINDNNILFPNFKFGEDFWFLLMCVLNSNTFFEDYRAYYQQYQTQCSICLSSYSNHFELNSQCIRKFQEMYPNECVSLQPFIRRTYYAHIQSSLYRILNNIDAHNSVTKYKMINSLCSKDEIIKYLAEFSSNENISQSEEKDCRDLLRKHYLSFAARHYYYPHFKTIIKNILRNVR